MASPYATVTHTADSISRWTGLGIEFSIDLADAIAVFEAVKYVEIDYRPTVDISDITPENAETKVYEFAEQLLPTLVAPVAQHGRELSALGHAKNQLLDVAARRVITLGKAEVPSMIEQLTPAFDQHAAAYAAAASELPEDLTDKALLSAGADAVAAYSTAKAEAAWLTDIARWSADLASLGLGGNDETALLILRPVTLEQLTQLDQEASRPHHTTTEAERAVGLALLTAVRNDIEFRISTPKEAAQIRADIESGVREALNAKSH